MGSFYPLVDQYRLTFASSVKSFRKIISADTDVDCSCELHD